MSELEDTLAMQMRAVGIPHPVREYKFDPKRRWRADFAWPESMLLVEVEGGHWIGGRHTRGSGFDKDAEKYNEAALAGWTLIRVTSTHVKSGEAVTWIQRAMT
jgi:very-short-patch-repair endonuclease